MQIVINLSEKDYKSLNRYINFNLKYEDGRILSAVKQGTVLPENPTNGDMINALFPNLGINSPLKCNDTNWWNTPYKGGQDADSD